VQAVHLTESQPHNEYLNACMAPIQYVFKQANHKLNIESWFPQTIPSASVHASHRNGNIHRKSAQSYNLFTVVK